MPWTLEYKGRKYAIQDGDTYTTIDRSQDFGGNYIIKETKHHQDGYKEVRKREVPVGWAEEQPLPSLPENPCKFTPDKTSKLFREYFRDHGSGFDRAVNSNQNKEDSLDYSLKGLQKHEEKLLKSKGLKVKKTRHRTGLRVEFRSSQTPNNYIGTIVTPDPEHALRPGLFLVCADFARGHFRDLNMYTDSRYGIVVKHNCIRVLPDQSSAQAFSGVPDHIGVMVHASFKWEGIDFPRYSIGRLLRLDGDLAVVDWFNLRSSVFYEHERISRPGRSGMASYSHCYPVPASALQWCRWDSNHEVKRLWRGSIQSGAGPKFKSGDYVVYVSPKPARISGERNYAVVKGAILRIKSHDSQGSLCIASLVNSGGLSPSDQEAAQLEVRLDPSYLALLEFPYIEAGNKVEITAALEFKKEKLQGARGLVILPTDADGDVGIQFHEDIGAGSLDGAGKSRHCLYVPAHSLQKVS